MRTKLFFAISVIILGTLLSACGPSTIYTQPAPPQRTLTVTGSGMVTLTPDMAYISIGVHTQDESATAAIDENNARAQAVIATIMGFDVAEADIQTTNFSIYPRQDYDNNGRIIGVTYLVDNTVYVTVRDLDSLGDLLDAVVQSGANTIGGISFDVSDRTTALSQARLAAVANARAQADELAEATGVSVGAVQTISYYDTTPSPYMDYALAAPAAEMAARVPVQAGTMQITTMVTIVYEIED